MIIYIYNHNLSLSILAQAKSDKAAPQLLCKRAMLGAASPLVAAGEILLGDSAVRGVFTAQPLGVLALFVASVAALVALTGSTTCCRPAHGSPTVVLLPSGARVTVNHG